MIHWFNHGIQITITLIIDPFAYILVAKLLMIILDMDTRTFLIFSIIETGADEQALKLCRYKCMNMYIILPKELPATFGVILSNNFIGKTKFGIIFLFLKKRIQNIQYILQC